MMYRLVISLVGFLLGATVTSNSATLVWTNSAGGVWNVTTNWSPNQVPVAADQVFITNGGTYTVTIGVNSSMAGLTLGGPAGVQTLQLAGGTMNLGAASLSPNGRFHWADGTLNGVLTIASNGLMVMESTATKTLNASITNRGTIQWTAGQINAYGTSGARLENFGLVDVQGDVDFYGLNGPPVLVNRATLRKSAGTGTARFGVNSSYPVTLENTGAVESQSGVLQFFGGGSLNGSFATAGGTRIEFVGGTYTQTGYGSPLISGPGSTRLTGGTLQLHDYPPGLQITGGTVVPLPDFQGGGSITNLVIEGGTLSGTNIVTGTLRWRDGTLNGVLTIASNGLMVMESTATKTLNASITNRGTIQWTAGQINAYGTSGARLENFGLVDVQGDVDFYGLNGPPVLVNRATLRKSAGTGTARFGVNSSYPVTLENTGAVESQSGVLQFFGGGSLNGSFATAGGTRIEFVGGTYTQTGYGSPLISGPGSTRLTGGTLQLHDYPPGLQITGGTVVPLPDFQGGGSITNLVIEGGTLSGTNIVTGTLRWRDGTLNGVLTIASNGLMVMESTATKTLNASVTNRGTIQWTAGQINAYGTSGARLENFGLVDVQGDVDFYGLNGPPVLVNRATLRKSAGTGTARFGVNSSYPVTLENTGAVESQSGVLQFFGGGSLNGSFATAGGTRIEFVGGTYTQTGYGSPLISGPGSTRLTGGTLQLHDYPPGLQITGGTVVPLPDFQGGGSITNLVIEGGTLSGTNIVTGTLRWRDGTLNGVLTIASNGLMVMESTATKTLNASITNRGTIQWTAGQINAYGTSGARLENFGLVDVQGDVDFYGLNGPPVLVNRATLRKSAGTGTARFGVNSSYPVTLENTGAVESQSGVLQFFGGGSLNGSFATAGGTRIEFVGGTYTQTGYGSPLVTGPGSTRFTGGLLQLLNSVPNLQLIGGSVLPLPAFQAGGIITNLTLQGATLIGTNTVLGALVCQSVSGPLTVLAGGSVNWNDGTFAGPVLIESNAVLMVSGPAVKTLNGALTNRGTIQWTGAGQVNAYGASGARIENFGLMDLQDAGDLFGINTPPVLANHGTLRKSAGPGTTRIGVNSSYPVTFENTGLVESLSGVLQFFGNNLLTGSYSTLTGARIEFAGGTWTQPAVNSVVFAGSGQARFTGGTVQLLDRIQNLHLIGGTAVLLPDFQAAGAITNLVLEGATLIGTNSVLGTLVCQSVSGPLTVLAGGNVNWNDGTFTGPVLVESNAVLMVSGPAVKTLNGALTNRGTIQWTGAGQVNAYGASGARIENFGLMDLQDAGDLFGINTPPVLANHGTLRKSAGPGTTRIGVNSSYPVTFENTGTVESIFGTVEFFGSNNLAGGALRVAIRSLSDFGRVRFNTAPTLTGTLSAYLVGGYLPVVSNKFSVVTFNSATGAFTDTLLPDGFVWLTTYEATAVSITVQGACTPPPNGLLAWWPGDGNANDLIGNLNGSLRNGASFGPGLNAQAFNLDGANDFVEAPDSPTLAFGTNDFTVALWANLRSVSPSTLSQPSAVFIGQDEGTGNLNKWFFSLGGGFLNFHLNGPAIGPRFLAQTAFAPAANTWYHLAATRSNGVFRVYTNAVLGASQSDNAAVPDVAATLTLGQAEGLGHVDGLLDEIIIVTRALSAAELNAIRTSGSLGLCRPTQPPIMIAQPQSRTNAPGTTASFSATAGGSSPLQYRWLFNGAPLSNGGRISGATSNVITITSVQAGDAGAYSLSVSNAAGAIASQSAQLVVDGAAPVISLLATNPGVNQCLVAWQTSEPATTVVEFGPTTDYGFTNRVNGLLTQHGPTLTGLIPGTLYHFRVRSADSVSNETISADYTFTTLPAPDLRVVSLVVTNPGTVQSGVELTIRWVLTNAGVASVTERFNDRVVVRNNTTATTLRDVSLLYDPGAVGSSAIPPGQTLGRETKYRLPDGPAGSGALTITVTTDSSDQIIEWHSGGSGETNNVAQINLNSALPPYPDLQPVNLILTPTNLLSGSALSVLWQNTNSGTGPAVGLWWDRVLIVNTSLNVTLFNSTIPFNTAESGAVVPGSAASRSLSFNLPDSTNAVGKLLVTVTADFYDSVYEYVAGRNAETNNNATANATALLAQYPDLRIAALSVAPASPVSGDGLTVTWRLTNAGSAPVTGSFHDRVLLRRISDGAPVDSGSILYDPLVAANGPIAPGEFRNRQATLHLPDGVNGAGNFQVELVTDFNGQVLEINSTGNAELNNAATNAVTAQLASYPDLVVGNIVAPASGLPGATVGLRWSITNIGVGPVNDTWSEQLYWSDDAAIGNDTLLATFSYTNVISSGQFMTRTQSVVLPTLGSGNRWFVVRVDSSARVFELNESNNVSIGSSPMAVPAATTLTINSASVSEGNTVSATLIRNGNLASATTFALVSSDTNRLSAPDSVTISAGQSAVGLQLTSLENELVDGNALVTVQASAAGYASSSDSVTVVDDDQPLLTIQPSIDTLTEGAGPAAAVGFITRNTPTNAPLVVPLVSSDFARVTVPQQVTIPAGSRSTFFDINVGDNAVANLSTRVTISASVPGYNVQSAVLTIVDDDTPALTLSLSDPILIENAQNPAGTLTVTRSPVTSGRARLAVYSSLPNVASVPANAIIQPGEASVAVPITVFNDNVAIGARVVQLQVVPTDDVTGTPLFADAFVTNVVVSDDDGPALTVQINAGVIAENGSTTGTVRRNTTATSNLVVQLTSSLPGEAAVPATVTILNGQVAATFPINGVLDNQPDGNRYVSITATAAGFSPGAASLNVSDIDLPDLRPVSFQFTNIALSDALLPISFVVSNSGLALAEGLWVDRVYLATSPAGDGLRLAGQASQFNDVPVGSSYTKTVAATMPNQAGVYWVIVVVDENTALNDGNRQNNRLVSLGSITVNPAYRATIKTDLTSTVAGTPIPLYGRAFRPTDNSPVANQRVTIRTNVKGVRRVFDAFSDASGNITSVFRPFPNEAGFTLLSADHPGVSEDVTQDSVNVFGLRFAEYDLAARIFPFIRYTGSVDVVNLGDLPVTGLSSWFVGLPNYVLSQVSLAETLPASGRLTLNFELLATNVVSATILANLNLTSAEGAVAYVPVRINLQPLTTTLVSQPGFIESGVARGEQKIITFHVENIGGIASGELTVVPPDLSWVSLSSPSNLPSLGPGESTRLTLLVMPPANAPLTLYDAPLYVLGANARLEVPMKLRSLANAAGDLRVEVQDDYTYYVEGAPRVTNATVRLTDPYTAETVAVGTTFPGGSIVFTNLLEGFYQMRVTAPEHATYAAPVQILAGVETPKVIFIDRQTVSYRWTVVPTTVEDRYRIVLEPVFQTEVPVPVVTVDNPQLSMLVRAGGEGQFDLRLSNHGLIAAERVTVIPPIMEDFELIPLVDVIDVFPAKSSMTIPIMVRAKHTGGLTAAGLPTCGKTITGCDSLPKMELKWSWICGADRRWHGLQVDVEMNCAKPDCWDLIKDFLEGKLKDNAKDFIKGKNIDLKALPTDCICDIINIAAQCIGITDACVLSGLQAACGVLTDDIGGAAAGGAGIGFNCICPDFGLPSYEPGQPGDLPGGGGTYESSPADLRRTSQPEGGWEWDGGDCEPGLHPASAGSNGIKPFRDGSWFQPLPGSEGAFTAASAPDRVCARVRIRLEQQITLTRQAFLGSLEVDNGNPDLPLTGVQVVIDIRDDMGQTANDRFAVRGPELEGLTAVDGTGVINSRATGAARYTFIPTRDAAPVAPRIYRFGGTLVYYVGPTRIEVPLAPEAIAVHPDPALHLDYFLQRDVFSDDPFTDEVEPSEPFALGLLVRNLGHGPARNFRLVSGQPKIIENEKGLLIDFKLIGTQVGNLPISPSLNISLGDIDAGTANVAAFYMTASLQGKFIEYNATFQHVDAIGDSRIALIDSLNLHSLTKVVLADRPGDDTLMDFLADDVPDAGSTPDTLWMSDGSQAIVNLGSAPTVSAPVAADRLQVQLTATMPAGWAYLKLPDPGPRFRLYRVVRSDGRDLSVGTNAWTTDRSFPSSSTGAIRENLLHLLDYDSTGIYTLYYRILDGVAPTIVSVGAGVPAIQTAPLDQLDVVTSERIELDSFTASDLVLTLNGGLNLITPAITVTNVGTNVYRISGLAPLTGPDGNYLFTVLGAGLIDVGGNPAVNDGIFAWAKGVQAPVVAAISAPVPNPRSSPVTNLDITFTQPIDVATFTPDDLRLTRDGGANLLDSTVSLSSINATTFRLEGLAPLTLADGVYALTASGTGVATSNGVPGIGALTRTWTMLTTGPSIAALEAANPNPRNIVVQALEVTFARAINPATFDWHDLTLTRNGGPNLLTSDVQVNRVNDTAYRISNFSWVQGTAGNYTLTVSASGIQDLAGNSGFGTRSVTWTLDLTKPGAPYQLALQPDTGLSASDALTASNQVALVGRVLETNLTVRVYDDTLGTDLGAAAMNGTNFSLPITFDVAGAHALRIYSVDEAQNVSSNITFNAFLDQAPPGAELAAVNPSLRTNPVPSIDVTFSEPVNSNTVSRAAFALRRNGGGDLLTAAATVAPLNATTFRLGNLAALNATAGAYQLTLDLGQIQDIAGNRSSGVLTQSWTVLTSLPNRPPVIAVITNRNVSEGSVIQFQASASDPDLPPQTLTFSLGAGAPAGASIDPVTGRFFWRPSSLQGPNGYPIRVVVTDNGLPSMSATQTFIVGVRDTLPDVVVSIEGVSMLTSSTSSVPIRLDSGLLVTNLSFEIEAVPARLTNLVLQAPSIDVLGSTWQALGGGRYRASFVLRPAASTNRTLVRLAFTADGGNQSGFVNLIPTNVVAVVNYGPVANTAGRPGRVILIGSLPVLVDAGAAARAVYLHGLIGTNYVIEGAGELGPNADWQPVVSVLLSNNVQFVPLPPNSTPAFYRARIDANPATAQTLSVSEAGVLVRLTGQAGQTYLLEYRANSGAPWTVWGPVLMAASPQTVKVPGLSTNVQCRLRSFYSFPPMLQAGSKTGGSVPITLFGRPGTSYLLERTGSAVATPWLPATNTTLNSGGRVLLLPAPGNQGLFRAVEE